MSNLLISKTNNPFFNIATEEYLLKNKTQDYVILYINNPSLIIGKNQNTFAEVNLKFATENNIPIIRRISGGGTVYHDSGNIVISIIRNNTETSKTIPDCTQIIFETLKNLEIKPVTDIRNNIYIDKKKISGNAKTIFKNRILNHATTLFNSNLYNLQNSIKVDANPYISKATKSIKSEVTNIIYYLPNKLTTNQFQQKIIHYLTENISSKYINLTKTDEQNIQKLIKEKYITWDWNYAYSPDFKFNKSINFELTTIIFEIYVKKGIITEIELISHFEKTITTEIELTLKNKKLNYQEINIALKKINQNQIIKQIGIDQLIRLLIEN